MRQDGEPSVEEILDSIKKVIARDNRDSALADRQRRQPIDHVIAMEQPVIREEVPVTETSAPPVADTPAPAEVSADPAGVLDLEEEGSIIAEEPQPGLTNDAATRSMRDSLAALAMLAEPGMPPQIVRSGETSLEGLVRELIRPMLAQWLDDNLPEIVERLVKAEITRIAQKKS
ncbi:DUF2497 domain-containing protein [Altererythrobacter xixiisoli]|uniref:DUF2497 domain-containing protein n=1 Tax=Croceibacterium xixiisoli TaxID=1476466 RepID=A0A6I4TQS5_9SPHN|nr:DUF2497 domain-containing protein [Croceibacterium xixiisoli]MXO97451.1 DUF2497 domain-containing protein [Croceibacterium xixiisoli]